MSDAPPPKRYRVRAALTGRVQEMALPDLRAALKEGRLGADDRVDLRNGTFVRYWELPELADLRPPDPRSGDGDKARGGTSTGGSVPVAEPSRRSGVVAAGPAASAPGHAEAARTPRIPARADGAPRAGNPEALLRAAVGRAGRVDAALDRLQAAPVRGGGQNTGRQSPPNTAAEDADSPDPTIEVLTAALLGAGPRATLAAALGWTVEQLLGVADTAPPREVDEAFERRMAAITEVWRGESTADAKLAQLDLQRLLTVAVRMLNVADQREHYDSRRAALGRAPCIRDVVEFDTSAAPAKRQDGLSDEDAAVLEALGFDTEALAGKKTQAPGEAADADPTAPAAGRRRRHLSDALRVLPGPPPRARVPIWAVLLLGAAALTALSWMRHCADPVEEEGVFRVIDP